MDVAGALTAARRRREAETRLMREGLDVWRCKQQQLLAKKALEQQQLREMLLTYSPWGRPGGGAPNSDTIRKRKALQLETLYGPPPPATSPAPLSSPSGAAGAPSGAAGAPSGAAGAPSSGCQTLPRLPSQPRNRLSTQPELQTRRLRCDPLLLFQFQEADRRAVDNLLRYRTDPRQQEQYRLELDRMVQEKRQRQQQQKQQQQQPQQKHHHQHHHEQPQQPQQQDECHQQHEEDHVRRRRSAGSTAEQPERSRNSAGGVELVPLLDRRRRPIEDPLSPLPSHRVRAHLPTTDVTNVTKVKEDVSTEREQTWRDLAEQIDRKKRQMEATRADEMERSRRHFETWQLLWGRPGHGAPRDVKVKENLDVILYHHLDRGDRSDRADQPSQRAAPPTPQPAALAPPAPAAVAAR